MSDEPTMADAFLRLQHMTETFSGFTPHEIETMGMDEYARLTGRPTPAQAAHAALRTQREASTPPEPNFAETSPEPRGVDIASMDWATYAEFRKEAGIGVGREYGNGILDAHGSWADAAKAKAGRSAMAGNRNTVEAPKLTGRQERHETPDHRTRAERFTFPGSAYQG